MSEAIARARHLPGRRALRQPQLPGHAFTRRSRPASSPLLPLLSLTRLQAMSTATSCRRSSSRSTADWRGGLAGRSLALRRRNRCGPGRRCRPSRLWFVLRGGRGERDLAQRSMHRQRRLFPWDPASTYLRRPSVCAPASGTRARALCGTSAACPRRRHHHGSYLAGRQIPADGAKPAEWLDRARRGSEGSQRLRRAAR